MVLTLHQNVFFSWIPFLRGDWFIKKIFSFRQSAEYWESTGCFLFHLLIVKQVGMQGIPRRSILLLFLAVKHGQWFQWFAVQLVSHLWSAAGTNGFASFLPLLFFGFLQIMNKVTAGTIGAETHGMVCPAQVCLVFGVSSHGAQFGHAMGELALFAVLAGAVFTERSA